MIFVNHTRRHIDTQTNRQREGNLFKIFLPSKVKTPSRIGFLLICLKKRNSVIKNFASIIYEYESIDKGITSIVVVFDAINDMCIIRKPNTLSANDKFKTE